MAYASVTYVLESPRVYIKGGVLNVEESLAFTEREIPVEVENRHFLRAAVITNIRTSCGCAVADLDEPLRVPPRSSIAVPVRHTPGEAVDQWEISVALYNGGRELTKTIVRGRVASPFSGWPEFVTAKHVDGEIVVEIDRRYDGVITEVGAFFEDEYVRGRREVGETGITLRSPRDGLQSPNAELAVMFNGSEFPDWIGPILIAP